MTNLRLIYIFITKDKFFIKITKEIVKDVLSKREYLFFLHLDKEHQLLYLKNRGFNLNDIKNKTNHDFTFLKQ